MNILVAILAGVAGAAICAFAGFMLGIGLAGALDISSFEGASGYFVVSIAIIAGFIGLVTGIVLALRMKGGYRGFAAVTGRALTVLAVIGALITLAAIYRLATVEHFSNGHPRLEFEIRLPSGMAAPDRGKIDLEMQAGSQRSGGLFASEWMRQEDDRVILSGLVPLYTRTSSRILVVTLPGQPKLLFRLGLAATPKATTEYGAWQRVSVLDDMKADSQPRKPGASETFDIRVRVPDWTQ